MVISAAVQDETARVALVSRMLATGEARALRKSADLSLAAVGRLVGVAPQTVMRWERGQTRPTGERLQAYGGVLAELRANADRLRTMTRTSDAAGANGGVVHETEEGGRHERYPQYVA